MVDKIVWNEDLPHLEVRKFIAERLRQEPPSLELSTIVCQFLGVPEQDHDHVTGSLMSAISLIPEGWWFHLSHLEAKVIPTHDIEGAPVSNSNMYDFFGKPVGYSAISWDRSQLPVALCEALLKARYDLPTAFAVEASAKAHNDQMSLYQRAKFQHIVEREKHAKRRSN